MTWIAPEAPRSEPPPTGDERTTIEGYLDYQRQTLLSKCAGLAPEQLAMRAVDPSGLSLLGLVRHMAEVECSWFRVRFAGQRLDPLYYSEDHPDRDFDDGDATSARADFDTFAKEVELARAVTADRSLDDTFVHRETELSLRWLYLHMIEEYARHNGHADLLRERIDGATGE